jgi:uncharacterized protein (DUF433 family)
MNEELFQNAGNEIMLLEDYFEFDACDRIRIKGSRIAIEYVLEQYHDGVSPENIVLKHYPTLTLEQVHATITYYLHNQTLVDAYIKRNEEAGEAAYQEHLRQGRSEPVKRLLKLRAQQEESAGKTPFFPGRRKPLTVPKKALNG